MKTCTVGVTRKHRAAAVSTCRKSTKSVFTLPLPPATPPTALRAATPCAASACAADPCTPAPARAGPCAADPSAAAPETAQEDRAASRALPAQPLPEPTPGNKPNTTITTCFSRPGPPDTPNPAASASRHGSARPSSATRSQLSSLTPHSFGMNHADDAGTCRQTRPPAGRRCPSAATVTARWPQSRCPSVQPSCAGVACMFIRQFCPPPVTLNSGGVTKPIFEPHGEPPIPLA